MKPLTLWSLRWTPARGKHFVSERTVTIDSSQQWLDIFRADEPGVLFIVSSKIPGIKATKD